MRGCPSLSPTAPSLLERGGIYLNVRLSLFSRLIAQVGLGDVSIIHWAVVVVVRSLLQPYPLPAKTHVVLGEVHSERY